MVRTLGIIGLGAIGTSLLKILSEHLAEPLDCVTALVRAQSVAKTELVLAACPAALARRVTVLASVDELLARRPDLVVECAGHGALSSYGAQILAHGIDLLVVSSGALTDDALRQSLIAAARAGQSRLLISSGAIGGVDLVAASQLSGISSLTYTSRKPPGAWRGSPAEQRVDLGTLKEAAVFYEGSARDAARDYPKNANVAATLALAGPGLDATRVRLIADPGVTANVHEFSLRSAAVNADVRIEGQASPDNPKTSIGTAYALAREILNQSRPIAIG